MKVVHVITRLIVGGAQENTISSVLGLSQCPDLQITLVSGPTSGPEGSLEPILKSRHGLLTILPDLVRPVHPWRDWIAFQKLSRLFQEQHPDIVHTHSGKAGVLGRLAARRAGVPLIVHTIHGPSFGPFQAALPNQIFRFAERRAASVTNHFVVVANAMREQYLAAGIGRPDQYTRIFSGFNLKPYLESSPAQDSRAELGLTPDDFVIGKIARLFKLKGHDDLLRAAPNLVAQCPQVRFLLIGDGNLRESLARRVRDLGLEKHFIFTGLVPPERIPELVGAMDVLVHLSRREGLARALPQALAAARPVIAYDIDGAAEVCLENETGFLIPTGNIELLSRRLIELSRDLRLRTRLGSSGRDFVRTRFSTEQMVGDLHQLYLQLRAKAAAQNSKA